MTLTRLLTFWADLVRPGVSLVGLLCDCIHYARGLARHIQGGN